MGGFTVQRDTLYTYSVESQLFWNTLYTSFKISLLQKLRSISLKRVQYLGKFQISFDVIIGRR